MRMEQYLTHTDYALWEVIVNGDAPAIASASAGTEGPIPPKTAEQKLARKNELKAKSTLLLAIPDEHLLKFYGIKDAKTLWEAIKARFRGNKESTKMQKTILKQQYENFAASRSEGLDKTYYSLQLDNEDLEQIDTDDLEEMDLKWQVAMLTMRVKRFLKKTRRNLNFNGKETVSFDKTKVEYYNCHQRGRFAKECRAPRNQGNRNRDAPRRVVPVETPTNALVVQDEIGGYDWSFQVEEGPTNFVLMAYTSQSSSSSNSNQMGLESLEAKIVVHEKDEAVYEEHIAFLKYDVQVKGTAREFSVAVTVGVVTIISLLEDMDLESAHMVAASKVLMLKPENRNNAPKTTVMEGVEKVIPPTTAEEKAQKRLEVKARSTLMMGIPNEHQLKFNSIKDAKLLLEAIEKSSETLDQTFDRLQKLVSQLEILGETLSQEDVNQKLLRSLSLEWNTHAVVWRNKPELETMSMDDLYKNLKVYEPEVKGTSSSNTSIQNMAFMSSNKFGSTNEAVNTAHGVSAVSTQVSAANSTNVDNLSDAVICAFFSSQPNNLQLVNEDL
ncbi:hypothetical protein Tco_0797359 [Tanacetum coccineum]